MRTFCARAAVVMVLASCGDNSGDPQQQLWSPSTGTPYSPQNPAGRTGQDGGLQGTPNPGTGLGDGDFATPGDGDNNPLGDGDFTTPGDGNNTTPGDGDATPVGDGDNTTPVTGGTDPVLPSAQGDCPTFQTGTATIGGLSGISLQVGPKQDGTGALLFYWHGTGSNSGEVNIMLPAAVRQEILNQGGIIVSPQGSLGTGGDCSGTGIFAKDDFKVMDLIAECAVKNYGINPRRIYTTGCSAGGLQAGCMATLRSDYIAAAVTNSGGAVFPNTIEDPAHIPALMTMHGGSADKVVVAFSMTSQTLDDQFSKAGGFVINCNHGGQHCGAPADAQTAGWQFMKDHPFGVDPEPYTSGIPTSFPDYCMEYP